MVNETAGKSIEEIQEMIGKKTGKPGVQSTSHHHIFQRSRSLAASVRNWEAVSGILPFNGPLLRDQGDEGEEAIRPHHQEPDRALPGRREQS